MVWGIIRPVPTMTDKTKYIRILMHSTLLLPLVLSLAAGCSKPREFPPTSDFSQRTGCPARNVQTTHLSSDRVLVSGCGERADYVRDCANGGIQPSSGAESQRPVLEAEARNPPAPFPSPGGCAWSRERKSDAFPIAPSE